MKNSGTGLVPAKSTGTGQEPVLAQIPPEQVPDRDRNRNSGRVLVVGVVIT